MPSYAHFAFFSSNYYEMQKLGTTIANSLVRNELPVFLFHLQLFPNLNCH